MEWADNTGEMRLENGTCTLAAREHVLLVRLSAPDEASVPAIQEAITNRSATIGRRAGLEVR